MSELSHIWAALIFGFILGGGFFFALGWITTNRLFGHVQGGPTYEELEALLRDVADSHAELSYDLRMKIQDALGRDEYSH